MTDREILIEPLARLIGQQAGAAMAGRSSFCPHRLLEASQAALAGDPQQVH